MYKNSLTLTSSPSLQNMASIFWKHLNLCFSHFKCLPTSLPPPSSPPHPHQTLVSKNPNSNSSPPDFSTIFASDRFFFSSPGQSKSILHSPENPPPLPAAASTPVGGGVAVMTDSPDPYLDFRRSMQEMVEAREYTDVEGDWDFLHELLLCYLMLNPKHTHKFIVGAFSDLLISLMETKSINPRKIDNRAKVDNWSDSVGSSSGSESDFSLAMKI